MLPFLLLTLSIVDMIVIGSNLPEIGELQDYLAIEFEMKDLGDLKILPWH